MTRRTKVLIIDDEADFAKGVCAHLNKSGCLAVYEITGEAGIAAIERSMPNLVILDLRLPRFSGQSPRAETGIEILESIKNRWPDLPVVMLSAHGDTRAAVNAGKRGAEDYITKPCDFEDLVILIRQASSSSRESKQKRTELLGESECMQKLRKELVAFGKKNADPVLILGECGTGKELAAKILHENSPRPEPFVAINCGAIPSDLIASELFGHEAGAFTDAKESKLGRFEQAGQGTLFLDEFGELPLPVQANFLRVLQERTFHRVGAGGSEVKFNGAIIAATNQDLRAKVADGSFREDLWYRVEPFTVTMPTLSERGRDVILLAEYFARKFAQKFGSDPIKLDDEIQEWFMNFDWPGNVRQLENIIQRASVISSGKTIGLADLPAGVFDDDSSETAKTLGEKQDQLARETIAAALADAGGIKQKAAESMGLSRHQLKRLMQKLGMVDAEQTG